MKRITYLLFALLCVLGIIYFYNKYRVAPSMDFSRLQLFDLDEKPFDWRTLKGKKLVVSFGASWCVNCRDEMKVMNKLKAKELADVDIVIISDEPIDRVRDFAMANQYPFLFLKMNQSFNSIGINAVPVNYIVDRELKVKHEEVGAIEWEEPGTLAHMKKLME